MTQTPTDAELIALRDAIFRCQHVVYRNYGSDAGRTACELGPTCACVDGIAKARLAQGEATAERRLDDETQLCPHPQCNRVLLVASNVPYERKDCHRRAAPTQPVPVPPMEFIERVIPKTTPPAPHEFGHECCLWIINRADALCAQLHSLVTPSAEEYSAANTAVNDWCREFWPELRSYIRSIEMMPKQPGEIAIIVQGLGAANDWLHREYPNISAHHRDNITKAVTALRIYIHSASDDEVERVAQAIWGLDDCCIFSKEQVFQYARAAIAAMRPSEATKQKLIIIGTIGSKRAFLNTSRKDAVDIYKLIEDETEVSDDMIQEIEFDQSFCVYDAWR